MFDSLLLRPSGPRNEPHALRATKGSAFWPRTLALPLLLVATACSQPTTKLPTYSDEEVQAEQASMAKHAINNPFPAVVEPARVSSGKRKRLQAISDKVTPKASKMCYELFGLDDEYHRCNFRLELSSEAKGVNAFADGERVVISPVMMKFAAKDTHLAFVVAHELAHNIMRHPQRGGMNAVAGAMLGALAGAAVGDTSGGMAQTGMELGVRSYSPGFEAEADYIALYILARAGYKIEQAPDFWRAMSQFDPTGIYASTTHPTNAERFVVMRKTIAEIRAKQKKRQPLLPEFLKDEREAG